METGIYEIVCEPTGKRYIGSAVDFGQRWNEHRSLLRRGRHHSRHLQAAWRKYGEPVFAFRKLLVCASRNLLMYEQIALDALAPAFNACPIAGSTLGRKHSAETRAKIAAKAIGRQRSRESVERGAAKRRGVPLTPEHAAKLIGNKHAAGLRHTEEWKVATSARQMGMKRPKDAAWRAKIAASLRGRKATPEARANQSAAQTGIKRGPYKRKALQ